MTPETNEAAATLRGYLRGDSDGYKAAIEYAMQEVRRQMTSPPTPTTLAYCQQKKRAKND